MPIAIAIFAGALALIASERVDRTKVALLGGVLVLLTQTIDEQRALAAIEFNALGLLAGMMIVVRLTETTGVYSYIAVRAGQLSRGRPFALVVALATATVVLSAFLDNLTTILLLVPITFLLADEFAIDARPLILIEIMACNIGGAGTLIGDPPNIMIGSATGLTFNDFAIALTPVIVVVFVATMIPLYYVWGRHLRATEENRRHVMSFNENEAITDSRLLKQSLAVIALVIAGFMLQRQTGIEPATTAIFGAAVLLLLDNLGKDSETQSKNVHGALSEAEWITLMFFLGLFILVFGVQKAGLINLLADALLKATGGDFNVTALAILWASAILSAFIDNIPFVATMIPLIKAMGPSLGGDAALLPLWWALSLGACLGGNGTLIGASANLVVAGLAERAGTTFRFVEFLKVAFPLMLISIVISHAYLYLRYL